MQEIRTTELGLLLEKTLDFYRARDWEQFHSPKNLVMNLASEVGELIDPFRFITEKQSHELSEKTKQEVYDEMGDIFRIVVYLAHKLGIDPVEAANQKLEKMEKKYPAEVCKGKANKYTEYQT